MCTFQSAKKGIMYTHTRTSYVCIHTNTHPQTHIHTSIATHTYAHTQTHTQTSNDTHRYTHTIYHSSKRHVTYLVLSVGKITRNYLHTSVHVDTVQRLETLSSLPCYDRPRHCLVVVSRPCCIATGVCDGNASNAPQQGRD